MLAQCRAPSKGYGENEALLEILQYLKVPGATITADAIACRRVIAEAILAKKANYVLALKGNQREVHDAVKTHFHSDKFLKSCNFHEDHDKGHGRIESRRCWASEDLRSVSELPAWPGLKSIICIESERIIGDHITCDRRYYLSNLSADAEHLLKIIRSHWSIENSLHWVLDVTFF